MNSEYFGIPQCLYFLNLIKFTDLTYFYFIVLALNIQPIYLDLPILRNFRINPFALILVLPKYFSKFLLIFFGPLHFSLSSVVQQVLLPLVEHSITHLKLVVSLIYLSLFSHVVFHFFRRTIMFAYKFLDHSQDQALINHCNH